MKPAPGPKRGDVVTPAAYYALRPELHFKETPRAPVFTNAKQANDYAIRKLEDEILARRVQRELSQPSSTTRTPR